MKIIIFGKTLESARRKLDEILTTIPYSDVKEVRKSKYDYIIDLYDGTRYLALSASNNARGHRANKGFVECGIDPEILNCVIKPILNEIEYF